MAVSSLKYSGTGDAEVTLYLGRPAIIDAVAIALRADFPHDCYWESAFDAAGRRGNDAFVYANCL